MKIYAPNKNANGVYASVLFVNGVGETNKPHLIEWFKRNGYTVEDYSIAEIGKQIKEAVGLVEIEPIEPIELMGYAEPTEKALEDMGVDELRDHCKTVGKGHLMKNIRNKEKLIEIIRG